MTIPAIAIILFQEILLIVLPFFPFVFPYTCVIVYPYTCASLHLCSHTIVYNCVSLHLCVPILLTITQFLFHCFDPVVKTCLFFLQLRNNLDKIIPAKSSAIFLCHFHLSCLSVSMHVHHYCLIDHARKSSHA